MRYYGWSEYDFTPNLDKGYVLFSEAPPDWGLVKFRTVYARRAVCRYRRLPAHNTSPPWYPLYDPAWNNGSTQILNGECYVGCNHWGSDYAAFQTFYEFDTSFLGASATVLSATLSLFTWERYLPHPNVYGTGIYMNFYPSATEFIFTRSGGNPINLPVDGSGYAARFGPWPSPSGVYVGWDGTNSRETAPLDVSAINKVGHTCLVGVSSEHLTASFSGGSRYAGNRINSACITLAYLPG